MQQNKIINFTQYRTESDELQKRKHSKDPTPEGPALENPGGGYNALPPEGGKDELPR